MTSFLFWNINKKPLTTTITNIYREFNVDVIVLAECEIPDYDLLTALNQNSAQVVYSPDNYSNYLKIFTRYPFESISIIRDTGGVSIRRLVPPVGTDIIFAAVHLQSKLHCNDQEQVLLSTRLRSYIKQAENELAHTRTILFGDFNMNPFEPGVVGADGIHAVMNRRVAQKIKRTVQGEEKMFFYNPMWNFWGDSSPGPPGTYYYSRSGQIPYYCNIFAQVLIRPSLLHLMDDSNVRILTRAGKTELMSRNSIPDKTNGSDHLPIVFSVNLEEEC